MEGEAGKEGRENGGRGGCTVKDGGGNDVKKYARIQ